MKFGSGARRRPAISELVATLLMIAMTLAVGAGAWGYANTQAGVSERALANNYANTNNFLSEQFKVADMYFGSSTSTTVWVYNVGSIAFNIFSIRLYDSAGLINILYNYTASSKTDMVYDLLSTLGTKCRLTASSGPYESPYIYATSVKTTNAQTFALTIPAAQGGCASDPSYGKTFVSGTSYTVVVTGLYGNVVTYYQVK